MSEEKSRDLPLQKPQESSPQHIAFFDGQHRHGGPLICTSAAVHWLMASLLNNRTTPSTNAQIGKVMQSAVVQYDALTSQQPSARLLSHEDVFKNRPVPPCLATQAYSGHYLNLEQEEAKAFGDVVHVGNLHKLLPPASGCVVTAHDHTVAVHRDKHGALWLFDSLPALERTVHAEHLHSALQDALGCRQHFRVCDITLVTAKPGAGPKHSISTGPSAPTQAANPWQRQQRQATGS